MKCPIYDCNGVMKKVVRKNYNSDISYPGDSEHPDLVCRECKSIYRYYKNEEKNWKKNKDT